jgi:D-3-phosphoglycerate dehydrogenase / 2-oxoglutarate reductase
MMKILIAPSHLPEIEPIYKPALLTIPGVELVYPKRAAQMTEAELMEQLPGCVASLAGSEPYTPRVIEIAAKSGLKIIARAGVGYDGVDVDAATKYGIVVTYAPGTNHEAVGETALMLMLNLAKSFVHQHTEISQGRWPRRAYQPLRGRTLGIVGLGRTGQATTVRAKAFGMTVIATDPVQHQDFAHQHTVRFTTLEELLSTADYVSLHVPLTSETRRMINRDTLGLMKKTSYLINCSRGEVVYEPALLEALNSQRIAGAGLDVFEHEPPGDNPLTKMKNVVLTAHTAGVDSQSRNDMARVPAEAIAQLVHGHWPTEWVVNNVLRGSWSLTGTG